MKKYQLKTIADIIKVVNERNVDVLASDITEWLNVVVATKKTAESLGVDLQAEPILRWNDDGETGIKKIEVELKNETETEL